MSGSYIGKQPQYGFFEKQRITAANGVLTEFNLSFTCADSNQLLVSVGGVIQEGGIAYTVLAGTPQQIKFTEAPANGIEIFIVWLGKELTGPRFSSGMLTDQTALGAVPASNDQFLIYDTDASSLKKVAYSNVHVGIADMPANSVKVRDANSTGTPSDKTVADTQLLIGDGTGFTAATLSSDVTMTNAGAVTIAADAVTPAKINIFDDALAATTTHFLIADGTDYSSFALSGDVTASNAGAVTIADNAVTLAKMAGLVRGKIIVGDASGDPSALTMGTSEQVLRVNTAGTDLEYADAVGGAAWALKTAGYTAVAGDGVMVDTDSSAITVTLPISTGPPSLGDFVRVLDATGNAATNNITVARNGNNIQGAAADLTIATNRAAIGLVYVNATEGWVLIEN